jgi:magnesium transporter
MAEILGSKSVQRQLTSISESLNDGTFVQVRKLLHDLPSSDVALLLESSPSKTRNELWQLIDADFHGDVLEELSEDVRNGIISKMVPSSVVDALEDMDTDDLAETLSSLPDPVLQSILKSMDTQDRKRD